ncbi:MAG: hypothetical protein JSS76_12260 [Bacteroidetes bacterium]|nr:hypothetical protein [Bacteroidota bacterium]
MFAAMWQRTFLYRVWQRDRILATFFVLFILCQLFFTYKGVENTPFFHFGMYSAPHHEQASYPVYRIEVGHRPVLSGSFFDQQREIVYNTIAAYDGLRQLHWQDSLDRVITHRFSGTTADRLRAALLNNAAMDVPYQRWLFAYIADMRMIEDPTLSVSRAEVSYQPDGSLHTDSTVTLFTLRHD